MADKQNPQKELPQEPPQARFAGPASFTPTPPEKKTSWPELVGLPSEEAHRKIKEEMPDANVQVIPSNHVITMDFRLDRVRIFTDSAGKVKREPSVG